MIGVMVLAKTSYLALDKKRNFVDQQVSRSFDKAVFFVNDRKKSS
jgi:hypothetical protein